MKKFFFLFMLAILTSCNTIRVTFDYEKTADFSKYKTYNYYSNIESGMSELDNKRLFNALDEGLQNKGLSLSETPDFFIDIQTSQYQSANQSSVGVGLGGGGGNVGGGVSVGIPVGQASMNRQIIFEFVDENGIGLFWQAVSDSGYNPEASPEEREAQFKAIVTKVLEGFPPKSKAHLE